MALPSAFPVAQFGEVHGVEGVAQTPSASGSAAEYHDAALASDARDRSGVTLPSQRSEPGGHL